MVRTIIGSLVLSTLLGACLSQEPAPRAAEMLEMALRKHLDKPLTELTLPLVMLGEDFFGATPSRVMWDPRGDRLYFKWKRFNEREHRTFSHDLGTGKLERQDEDFEIPVGGVVTRGRSFRYHVKGQALLRESLRASRDMTPVELLRFEAGIRNLVLGTDEDRLFFRSGDGIYQLGLPEGFTQVLVLDTSGKKEPDEKKKNEKETLADWHKRMQKELFRLLKEEEKKRARDKELREKRKKSTPKVARYRAPKGWRVGSVSVSPAGDYAAVSLSKGKGGKRTEIPRHVTADGYARADSSRSKVGEKPSQGRLDIVDLSTGKAVTAREPVKDAGATPRGATWSRDGKVLLATAHRDDDTQMYLLRINPKDGTVETLHDVKDEAWTRSWLSPTFLADSHRAFFLSEATGYSHLYVLDADTGQVKQLTNGRFEVSSPQAEPGGRTIYALATPTSPYVRDLVAIDGQTGEMTILTADGGGRSFRLSPDGRHIAEVFSTGNRPWELRVRAIGSKEAPRTLTDSSSTAFKSYDRWDDPEIVRFKASDGVEVPARIYRPRKPARDKPAVLFVHGAGHLQNVHHWWSSYYREYGFHHILRDEGYVVMDVDYRGSAGYGRNWRTAIFGHMGGRDLEDYVDAARWLVENEGVSKDRIGIYGGSYGGFLTLMALFTKPGTFKAGAALRPVTDWAHYNDSYTSNILNDPLESPHHYARSSPINFAEGLQDHLLICHGVLDFNVHAQDTFRLQQRLIELRKTNWEVAYYPLEGHSFKDAASWADEYRRIKSLFDRVLKR